MLLLHLDHIFGRFQLGAASVAFIFVLTTFVFRLHLTSTDPAGDDNPTVTLAPAILEAIKAL